MTLTILLSSGSRNPMSIAITFAPAFESSVTRSAILDLGHIHFPSLAMLFSSITAKTTSEPGEILFLDSNLASMVFNSIRSRKGTPTE